MNGTENYVMTGSSNHRAEQLNWLSEIASAVTKGAVNRHVSSQNPNVVNNTASSNPHNVGNNSFPLFLSNSGTIVSPSAVLTRNIDVNSVRMFVPPQYQAERPRHVQPVSLPIGGTNATLYYSQAPRNTPYSNFFQATYSSPMTFSAAVPVATTTTVPVEAQRSYLQVDNYPSPSLVGVQAIGSTHSQLPCSPGYLQQPPLASSPSNLSNSTSVSHSRLFQQGRSILLSRSPEGMVVHSPQERDSGHVRIQLSPVLTQMTDDTSQRKSFASNDSMLGSSSCSPVIDTAHNNAVHDFTLLKETSQQRTSPSHMGYRMPTGKEGSLKHRILRPPSINIVDPPPSIISDAPLSAPPIRTHREPSPKQARSIPSSGYRSFSSSASSLTETSNRIASSGASPSSTFPNHCSSVSSGSPSPAPPASPTAAQLKYPQSFMKGAIIQLANNQLKQVENMTTEDFIECGMLSPTLRIDTSTVTSIEKMPSTGAAKLGFQVGQDNIQITVEAPLEHPFFVYKQGWSSCSPERSAQRYGLTCHKLKVGDTCISLTDKPRTSVNNDGDKKTTNLSVPTTNSATGDKNQNVLTSKTVETNEAKEVSQALTLPTTVDVSGKQSDQTVEKLLRAKSETPFLGRKRKRRWSAPDNLPQEKEENTNC
ncbi:ataxin-1-like isoform X2 [Argiope bruennichi]|uniref:Ataxin-1 like protein n=2 Tax=Argiope bruennichi TaxID=94029 RepID=A0A8T0F0Q3_ARGBR|nr:ataxin-1-like isoform X2 [Argiope bruennichi]XP_055933143.1 ataxin-1-like isoform X2 [Argiope bruennichi]KAF8782569.1 Ataxin-1 like protein [Argiope bruennichi]